MRHYHKMILKMLPGPIMASLSLLMFLLVMQFLMKYLPELVGKDLPFFVLVELISYNLAYMFVLAVPMSMLIATLMTFGRLVDTNAYSVIKSSGVSFPQLVWPALVIGLLTAGFMGYFNNEVLPEATNYRASNLWRSIRQAKPGFDLQPGVFYDNIDQYKILVGSIDSRSGSDITDVLIFDYTDGQRFRMEISARRGHIETTSDGSALDVVLFDGEWHRRKPPGSGSIDRYERMAFDRHRLKIPIDDLSFDRNSTNTRSRGDRTMRLGDMLAMIDSFETRIQTHQALMSRGIRYLGTGATPYNATARSLMPGGQLQAFSRIADSRSTENQDVNDVALRQTRNAQAQIERSRLQIESMRRYANQYRVEVHKKNSIAVACLVFMLIGAPLGLAIRRGGLGVAAAAAVAIFLFYWVTLVIGEKLADEGTLEPWIGMWIGNVVTGIAGLFLFFSLAYDWRAIRLPWQRALTPESLDRLD